MFSQLNLTLEETILTLDEPAGVDTSTAQQRLRSITGRKSFIPGHRSWGREWCHPQKLLPRRHNHMERCVKSSLGALSPSRPSLLSAAFTNDGSRTLEKEFQPAWWLRITKQLFVYQLLCQTHDIALDDQRWIRNWLALHQIMV